jgi:predicted negative regulator of RcsB-dependent stress response
MATLESDDSNIIDGETINLRLVIYPIVAAVVLILGGFGYYYYQQNQREINEANARTAFLNAKTPEALVQVADQYPNTDQATMALLKAADDSYSKIDYAASLKDYQRILDTPGTDPLLHDSAQLGLASALEATGKLDEAIAAYLEVAHLGDKSPYAPFGYNAVARIYEQRGDMQNVRKILMEETSLDPDSTFVKDAQAKLNQMSAAPVTVSAPSVLPANNAAGAAPAPAPVAPAKP